MSVIRQGLRLKINKIDPDVGIAFKNFAKWLRGKYDFPIRVPVYLYDRKFVIGRDKESYVSIFFAPYSIEVEPYIKIATGDYFELIEEFGKNDALFSLLYSLAIEVLNYQKWVKDNENFDTYDGNDEADELLSEYVAEVKAPL